MKITFIICFILGSIAQANHYFLGYEKSFTKSTFSSGDGSLNFESSINPIAIGLIGNAFSFSAHFFSKDEGQFSIDYRDFNLKLFPLINEIEGFRIKYGGGFTQSFIDFGILDNYYKSSYLTVEPIVCIEMEFENFLSQIYLEQSYTVWNIPSTNDNRVPKSYNSITKAGINLGYYF